MNTAMNTADTAENETKFNVFTAVCYWSFFPMLYVIGSTIVSLLS